MSALFSRPKVTVPKAPEPAPVPTIDDAAKQRTEGDRLRRRRGSLGNLMSGPLGVAVPAQNLAQKQLTGS
jgi:hypothetical protein